MKSLNGLTAAEKYDKIFDAFCDHEKMTFTKEHLIDIWNGHIDVLWDAGFDSIFGYSHQNDFLVSVLVPRIRRNKKWLLANGGENLVMTVHFYKNEIKAIFE